MTVETGKGLIANLLKDADSLLQTVSSFSKEIPGLQKLHNKIASEQKFLQGLSRLSDGKIPFKQSHATSTNLKSLKAIIGCLNDLGQENTFSILQRYKEDTQETEFERFSLVVDIVAFNGHLWIKVIARKPEALLYVWQGLDQHNDKNIIESAEDYIEIAKQNPVNFQRPKVLFYFANGIPCEIAKELLELDVLVVGKIDDKDVTGITETPDIFPSIESCVKDFQQTEHSRALFSNFDANHSRVNLDITAMICLVSNLTNGANTFTYGIPVLDQQAQDERNDPSLPGLKRFLEGKKMLACKTAVDNFRTIVATIGGAKEKERSIELLKQITIVDDSPSQRTINLATSSKLNERAKILFGTGDREEAITVTANTGFIRAAKQNGVTYSVFTHEARALTEIKEPKANC